MWYYIPLKIFCYLKKLSSSCIMLKDLFDAMGGSFFKIGVKLI